MLGRKCVIVGNGGDSKGFSQDGWVRIGLTYSGSSGE